MIYYVLRNLRENMYYCPRTGGNIKEEYKHHCLMEDKQEAEDALERKWNAIRVAGQASLNPSYEILEVEMSEKEFLTIKEELDYIINRFMYSSKISHKIDAKD